MVYEEKLPFGPPPVLPDVKEQLKEYLLHPEKLPIHDHERTQLFWPREPDVTDLFHYENSPVATTLKVQRNPFTGEIIEFREVTIDDVGLTSKNSTSLNRAPGPSSEVRGSTSNYPFWPGGFPDPILDLPKEENIDLTKDLLSIPPGFSRGLQFREDGCTLVTDSPPISIPQPQDVVEESPETSLVNLLSVVQKEQDLLGLWSDNKVSEEKKETNAELVTLQLDDKDVIPEEDSIPVLNISETNKKIYVKHSQWAEMIDVNKPVTDFEARIPDLAMKYKFELDTFQKQAILKLEEHCNVFVAAHTSAGKTVVAEYAIALSQRHSTRTIYTSPIKALSNQKYRDFKKIFKDVGLITGDFQINDTAACLIMTTEILRSMLYCGSDVIRDLEYVIFDEVHYINDADRGHVWEEVLILLPAHVTIVMLSATVPNTLEFADWVGCTKQRKVYVISTPKRPVPLMHYLYTGCGGKTKDDRFLIVDSNGYFIKKGYDDAVAAKNNSKYKKDYMPRGANITLSPNQEQTMWIGLIDHLKRADKLPVVAFTLSRKRCDQNAEALSSVDLNTAKEKHLIFKFFNHCIKRLKESDQELPQVLKMRKCLEQGIGVHHSGILPILKEIVEMLFQSGLVKILFATETFAVGVNMPTKTVLFDAIRKYDGKQQRDLLPAEYIQMAGRAGRRGKDTEGTVIIICKGDVPSIEQLKMMMLGKPEKLQSQFRLTYGMLLNILRVESLTVERMLSHSFREVGHRIRASQLQTVLENTEKELESLPKNLPEHLQKLTGYYDAVTEYLEFRNNVWPTVMQKWASKEMTPGRVLLITHKHHYNKLAVLLNVQTKKDVSYTVFVLNHQKKSSSQDSNDDINLSVKNTLTESNPKSKSESDNEKPDDYYKMLALRSDEIFQPDGVGGHEVLTIGQNDVFGIVAKIFKFDADLVIKDWNNRQIERFRDDPPGKTCNDVIQELTKLTHAHNTISSLKLLDVKSDLKIKDLYVVTKLDRLSQLMLKVQQTGEFTKIANFEKQFDEVFKKKYLEDKKKNLEFCISHQSMSLYPEYEGRVAVLKDLDYIDSQRRVKLKGRVACEIGTNELIVTELILSNVLTSLEKEEVAALLSCLVFQAKTEVEPNLKKPLQEGKKMIQSIEEKIRHVERKYAPDDVILGEQELNFGLVEVVYEWALQKPFKDIMELTDIQEGIIVRCIQQLNEILGDIKDAAYTIGDPKLQTKMEEASNCIKRDIVFAASLYTQDDTIALNVDKM